MLKQLQTLPLLLLLNVTAIACQPNPSPQTQTPDPWPIAVSNATHAVEVFNIADANETFTDWQAAVTALETTVQQLRAIPSDHPHYAEAQKQAQAYQASLEAARQNAEKLEVQALTEPRPSTSDNIKLTTYVVTGTTAAEIRADINRKRIDAIGQSFDAYARWWVRWNYQYLSQGSSCQIASNSLNVVLTGEIIMPEWDAPPTADPQLVQRWQQYITLLRAHEDQHIQHGREATQRIQEALPNLMASTCEQLEVLADEQGEAIIAQQAQKDKDYDAATDHGRLEGIQFP
ncbi:MAG: DUF922 domain-containing Zn-dependent protease [Spirulina sp. SIO3F2]|nr:DUF922 domain-containing Zn-dependent protease [Spirulina sp. SIO3F2]